jgi:hypothetical protein
MIGYSRVGYDVEDAARWSFGSDARAINNQLEKVGLKDHYIPKKVYDDMLKMDNFNIGKLDEVFKKYIDTPNFIWRSLLTMNPMYWGTNNIGNTFMNVAAGVNYMRDFVPATKSFVKGYLDLYPDSWVKKLVPETWLNTKEINPLFKEYAAKSEARLLSRHQMFQDVEADLSNPWIDKVLSAKIPTLGKKEVAKELKTTLDEIEKLKANPLIKETKDNFLTKKVIELEQKATILKENQYRTVGDVQKATWAANGFFEEFSKYLHYYSKRTDGLSPLAAAESMTKYLFNYQDLTQFEKKTMKRAVLFYTFARKNLPLAVSEMFLNRRAYFLAKGSLATETNNAEFVPEYVKNQGQIALSPETFVDVKNPFFEANRFSPQGGSPSRVIEKAGSTLSPLFKVPLELLSGREFYRGRSLQDLNKVSPWASILPGVKEVTTKSGTEYRANPLALELINNLPTTRFQQVAKDLVNEQILFGPNLLGVRATTIDPRKARLQAIKNELEARLSEDQSIREFKRYFSISTNPDLKSKRLLDSMEAATKLYTSLNREQTAAK